MKRRNITPLSLVLPVALAFSLFYALYYLFIENRGGMMLAGVLLLSLSIGLAAVFIVERIWVNRTSAGLRKIWLLELIVLTAFILFYAHQRSAYYYTVSDDTKWFATFAAGEETKKSHYLFPFNRELKVDSNQVIAISKKDIGDKREAIRPRGHKWRGYSWQCKEVTVNGRKIKLSIYCRPRTELTAIDYEKIKTSLLQQLDAK